LLSTNQNEVAAASSVNQGYECFFSDGTTLPCKPVLERMTNEELQEYGEALARYFSHLRAAKARLMVFQAANSMMLDTGSVDAGDVLAEEADRLMSAHPDTFLVPTPKTN
jgi:hypothetical protein